MLALLALAAPFALAGCGFQPIHAYGERNAPSVHADLADIKIRFIENRMGQMLRNELLDRLTPRGEPADPRYTLVIRMSDSTQALGILKDETSSRSNLIVNAGVQLIDNGNGRLVFSTPVTAQVSYNVLDAHFATTAAKADAESRASVELSHTIATQLAAYFARARAGAGAAN
jgi:LPS-assembly lipoprotein